MTLPSRKIVFLLLAGVVVLIFTAQSGLLTGRLVFFKQSPTNTDAVSASYINYNDAVEMLVNGALKAGRINSEIAEKYRQELSQAKDYQITREKFSELAVLIFGVTNHGYGSRFSDLPSNEASVKNIYLLNSNIGFEEFKPFNSTTKSFAEKTVQELSVRFNSWGK